MAVTFAQKLKLIVDIVRGTLSQIVKFYRQTTWLCMLTLHHNNVYPNMRKIGENSLEYYTDHSRQ